MDIQQRFSQIVKFISGNENGVTVSDMERLGVRYENSVGMSIVQMRNFAKTQPKNQEVAERLWLEHWRETMIIATMLAEPQKIRKETLVAWIEECHTSELIEQISMNLLVCVPSIYDLAKDWLAQQNERRRMAAYMSIAHQALRDEEKDDAYFADFLQRVEQRANVATVFEKRSLALLVRRIGRRSRQLNEAAIAFAERLKQSNNTEMQWVAEDALVELTDEFIQQRFE